MERDSDNDLDLGVGLAGTVFVSHWFQRCIFHSRPFAVQKKTSCVSVDLKQVLDKYKTELAGTGERSGNINDSEL